MLKVEYQNIDEVDNALFRYAIIVSRYQGKWIFCKNKARDTWELPAGTRESGEIIFDTAKRELYEETGALDYDLHIVSAFFSNDDKSFYSLLCFAEVKTLGPLPNFEIERIQLCDSMPAALTYPLIQPLLFDKVKAWLSGNGLLGV